MIQATDKPNIVYLKGAVEQILAKCTEAIEYRR